MKNLLSLLRNVSKKRLIPVLALAAAAAVPAVIMAWGPSRATFTTASPAPYVTFNSITDNPAQGDERNFMQVKPATSANSAYADSVTVQAGKEYDIFVYYHNNAASNLNASGKGIAQGSYVKTQIPAVVGTNTASVSYVGANNANPVQVWDDVSFKSTTGDMALSYIPGSAHIFNKGKTNGAKLSDTIVTSGAPIGFDSLNGVVPGCNDFAGYVVFKVKANQPNFTVSKLASKHAANKWVENYQAVPGETVDYLVQYKNTGTVQQDAVTLKDALPKGVTYVAGSSTLGNALHPSGIKTNDGITSSGINVGSYGPGGNAWVIFSAKVPANDALAACGVNTLHNVATAETDNGSKSDSADVTVSKTCVPPAAKYVCTGLNVSTISRTQFTFKATNTVENADFVKYTYVVKDASGKQLASIVGNNTTAVAYTQNTIGKYSVQAFLTVKVAGSEKTVTSADCTKAFEVKEQPVKPVYACESLQLIQKVSRDTFTFKVTPKTAGNNVSVKEYAFDFGDSQTAIVGVGQETQTHTYAAPGEYTATVKISFNVDGKTVSGITSAACKVNVTVEKVPPAECKPGIPVNDSRCETTPVVPVTPSTPTSLPSTGPIDVAAGLFGTSSLGFGIHAFMNSRRAIRGSMKR